MLLIDGRQLESNEGDVSDEMYRIKSSIIMGESSNIEMTLCRKARVVISMLS